MRYNFKKQTHYCDIIVPKLIRCKFVEQKDSVAQVQIVGRIQEYIILATKTRISKNIKSPADDNKKA